MYGGSYDQRPGVPVDAVLLGAAMHLDTGPLAAGKLVYSRGCVLLGWSFRERAGTPALAQADLLDGGSAGGELVVPFSIAASGTQEAPASWPGIQVKSGLYLNVIAGTLGGVLFIVPEQ